MIEPETIRAVMSKHSERIPAEVCAITSKPGVNLAHNNCQTFSFRIRLYGYLERLMRIPGSLVRASRSGVLTLKNY